MRQHRAAICALLVVTCALSAAGQARQPGDAPLREGVLRYHYYQGEYLPALNELLVARERGQDFTEETEGLLLEGALRLAFGMPDSAAVQLNRALGGRPAQRDAAHFYLGKLHYLNNNDREARDHWRSLGNNLRSEMALEARARQTMLALRQGEPANLRTERLWRDMEHWAPTVLYNLAGQRARAGDYTAARRYYTMLTEGAPRRYNDPEYLALRDKAYTAAGFTWLLEENYPAARDQFARVRLNRPEANRALLGYGWALAESGDLRAALSPWQLLSERAVTDASVQEALLAVPYAYQQLGLTGPALEAYDRAETVLEAELQQLVLLGREMSGHRLLAHFRRGQGGLVQTRADRQLGQNWLRLDREDAATTDQRYLLELVSESQFQARVQAIRDLLEQQALLLNWQERLEHYARLQQEQQARRHSPQAQAERQQYWQQAEALRQQRQPLVQELARVRDQRDYLALADTETRDLYAMTERALASAGRLATAGADIGDARERLRLYQGILLWRAAQDFPANHWRAEKQRIRLDLALAELDGRRQRVETLLRTDPDTGPNLQRITQLETRIELQLLALDDALNVRAGLLAGELQTHLGDHRQRLHQYLARTRLSAARLQDEILRAGIGLEGEL